MNLLLGFPAWDAGMGCRFTPAFRRRF